MPANFCVRAPLQDSHARNLRAVIRDNRLWLTAALDVNTIRVDLLAHVSALQAIPRLQVWALTPGRPMVAMEIQIAPDALGVSAQTWFRIEDATIEVKCEA